MANLELHYRGHFCCILLLKQVLVFYLVPKQIWFFQVFGFRFLSQFLDPMLWLYLKANLPHFGIFRWFRNSFGPCIWKQDQQKYHICTFLSIFHTTQQDICPAPFHQYHNHSRELSSPQAKSHMLYQLSNLGNLYLCTNFEIAIWPLRIFWSNLNVCPHAELRKHHLRRFQRRFRFVGLRARYFMIGSEWLQSTVFSLVKFPFFKNVIFFYKNVKNKKIHEI